MLLKDYASKSSKDCKMRFITVFLPKPAVPANATIHLGSTSRFMLRYSQTLAKSEVLCYNSVFVGV